MKKNVIANPKRCKFLNLRKLNAEPNLQEQNLSFEFDDYIVVGFKVLIGSRVKTWAGMVGAVGIQDLCFPTTRSQVRTRLCRDLNICVSFFLA